MSGSAVSPECETTQQLRMPALLTALPEPGRKRFISLFPAFLAVKEQCPHIQPGCWYERFFIFGDVHYSNRGNALVAAEVIESLAATPPSKAPALSSAPSVSKHPAQSAHSLRP